MALITTADMSLVGTADTNQAEMNVGEAWVEIAPSRDLTMERNQLVREITEPRFWSGRYGRKDVSSMTIKHIKNCLARCKRDNWRTQYIPKFEEEIRLREPLLQELHNQQSIQVDEQYQHYLAQRVARQAEREVERQQQRTLRYSMDF